MKRRLKVNGVIMALAFVMLALFPKIFLRIGKSGFLEEMIKVFGMALILLGQLLRVCGRGYKAEHSRQGGALIQGGPYALVRNPMYLGIFFIGLGIVAMLFKWWVICIFVLVFILRYILLIFKEEKKLFVLFPQEYPAYCRKTPRILPSLAAVVKQDIKEYLPLKSAWIKKEIGTMLAVLFVVIGAAIYLQKSAAFLTVVVFFVGLIYYLVRATDKAVK